MKNSTRKLIGRIKQLIKEASAKSREYKELVKTPYAQRPPVNLYSTFRPNWAQIAHILSAVRADMRGHVHCHTWVGDGVQRAEINKILELCAKTEKSHQDGVYGQTYFGKPCADYEHPTWPKWLRETVQAAFKAGDEERVLRVKRNARYSNYKAGLTTKVATG